MRSEIHAILPSVLRRSLAKMGADISAARRKRGLTIAMMAERLAIAKATYGRIERGDPKVALGAYAMAFMVLGFGDVFRDLIDASRDEQGLALDAARLPKRVRPKKAPVPL